MWPVFSERSEPHCGMAPMAVAFVLRVLRAVRRRRRHCFHAVTWLVKFSMQYILNILFAFPLVLSDPSLLLTHTHLSISNFKKCKNNNKRTQQEKINTTTRKAHKKPQSPSCVGQLSMGSTLGCGWCIQWHSIEENRFPSPSRHQLLSSFALLQFCPASSCAGCHILHEFIHMSIGSAAVWKTLFLWSPAPPLAPMTILPLLQHGSLCTDCLEDGANGSIPLRGSRASVFLTLGHWTAVGLCINDHLL